MSGLTIAGSGLTLVNPSGGGGSTPPGGSNLQIQWNNSGAFDGFTASGDATIDVTTGVVTVGKISGGARFNYRAVTSTATASATDYFIDCTSGTFTVNLPTAVGIAGRVYVIKNSGTGVITIDANGSETIDGALTKILAVKYESFSLFSDGANWKVF